MPRRAAKPCSYPGCANLASNRHRCPQHPLDKAWSRGEHGYRRDRWQWAKTKRRILARDNYTCRTCGRPAITVDHVRPVSAGGTDDDGNLAAICGPCHHDKTVREAAAARWARNRAGKAAESHGEPLLAAAGTPMPGAGYAGRGASPSRSTVRPASLADLPPVADAPPALAGTLALGRSGNRGEGEAPAANCFPRGTAQRATRRPTIPQPVPVGRGRHG